jgi:hypothetical protein
MEDLVDEEALAFSMDVLDELKMGEMTDFDFVVT